MKQWLEESFNWLIDEMGAETLLSVEVILPTEEYFPDPYSGSPHDIRMMLERVCGYMDVDPGDVEMRLYTHDDGSNIHPLAASEREPHAIGTYQMRGGKYHIRLESSQAVNPEKLVGTIAHELGHVILLGEDRLDPDYEDHELLTDLLTVFYGLGIFSANSSFSFEQYTNAQFQGWQASRAGYLTEEMYGYGLALFAYARSESKPEWSRHLSTNVKHYFKQGLKYLVKGGETGVRQLRADGR
jgi:hypothetical protein